MRMYTINTITFLKLVCRISDPILRGDSLTLSFIPFSVTFVTPSSFQNPCSPSPMGSPTTHLHSLSKTSPVCAQWPTMNTPSLVHMHYLHRLLLRRGNSHTASPQQETKPLDQLLPAGQVCRGVWSHTNECWQPALYDIKAKKNPNLDFFSHCSITAPANY